MYPIFSYLLLFSEQLKAVSLRKRQDEDDQFNELKVTPEFQKFVASKLSQILDKQLSSYSEVSDEKPRKKRKIKGGVKLLSSSQVYLDVNCVEVEPVFKKVPIKKRPSESDEAEMVREAAVTPETILKKEELKHWSKLYTKPHFKYKANATGDLILIDD